MKAAFLLIFAIAARAQLTPAMQKVSNHITADSLRGHLSFIASDLLEGRGTPSRGLNLAAEYIAAQFRRAGLEPIGDDGYFQTATVTLREPNRTGFKMTVSAGGKKIDVDPSEVYMLPDRPLDLENAPVLIVKADQRPNPDEARGRIVFRLVPQLPGPQVRDSETSPRPGGNFTTKAELAGLTDAHVTLHMEPAVERQEKVHNVAGILRGSDPALRDTYVMLTAHYDHVGPGFDGANDDGSGTVSVLEIASALSALDPKPARSVLFMTFFGEERGLVGSRYYGRHPLVPLAKTIADLNLEQIGRTDATNGPQVGTASITGFDFSDLPGIVADAGKLTGVRVYKDPEGSDPYFARSDNQALADAGVPAHTLCVAFDYPDYHGMGDHWQKIDYDNMAKVDRTVALSMMLLASDAPPPKWNAEYPAAKKYAEAAQKLVH